MAWQEGRVTRPSTNRARCRRREAASLLGWSEGRLPPDVILQSPGKNAVGKELILQDPSGGVNWLAEPPPWSRSPAWRYCWLPSPPPARRRASPLSLGQMTSTRERGRLARTLLLETASHPRPHPCKARQARLYGVLFHRARSCAGETPALPGGPEPTGEG